MPADVSGAPVLLLHGSGPGTTAAAWDPLVAALAPRHRVIAPDLLGFAASPRPVGSLRAAWTRQALELVDSLGVVVVRRGRQLGGRRDRARDRRHAPGGGHPRGRRRRDGAPHGAAGRASTRCGATTAPSLERAEELIELINFDPAAATPAAVEARYRATLAQPWYPELFPPPRQRWVDDLSLTRAELAAITAPVLLIHGAQDRIVPLRDGFLPLLEVLPDVRGHVFGACGHAAPLERTDEFNQLLTTFLGD